VTAKKLRLTFHFLLITMAHRSLYQRAHTTTHTPLARKHSLSRRVTRI
jgi:hypothetical protein